MFLPSHFWCTFCPINNLYFVCHLRSGRRGSEASCASLPALSRAHRTAQGCCSTAKGHFPAFSRCALRRKILDRQTDRWTLSLMNTAPLHTQTTSDFPQRFIFQTQLVCSNTIDQLTLVCPTAGAESLLLGASGPQGEDALHFGVSLPRTSSSVWVLGGEGFSLH